MQFLLVHVHHLDEIEALEKLASVDQASNKCWHFSIMCDFNVFV